MKPTPRPTCRICHRTLVPHDLGLDAQGHRLCLWCSRSKKPPQWDMPPVPIDRGGNRIRYPAGMSPEAYPAYLAGLKGRKAPVNSGGRKTRQEVLV